MWAGLQGPPRNLYMHACPQTEMAERRQSQRLQALRNDRNLARFVVEGRATGNQLGTGSYGSVEEVYMYSIENLIRNSDRQFNSTS